MAGRWGLRKVVWLSLSAAGNGGNAGRTAEPDRWMQPTRLGDDNPGILISQQKNFLTISIYLYILLLMLSLDVTFSALADPTRRAILAHLALGEATVNELARPFEMTQPAISQHLKVLEEAGLIVRRVDGTKRPRRLAKAGIEALDQWLAMLRKALEKNYDRLDGVLAEMETQKKEGKR